ncbi:MAG: hypothetical protein AAF654_09360 [Myxococcota bacterium]
MSSIKVPNTPQAARPNPDVASETEAADEHPSRCSDGAAVAVLTFSLIDLLSTGWSSGLTGDAYDTLCPPKPEGRHGVRAGARR